MADTRIPMTRALGMGPLPTFVEEMAGHRALQRIFHRQRLPLSLIDNRDMRLPLAAMRALFEDAAREVGDRGFGLRVGEEMTHAGFGLWARYIASAPTLERAIRRSVQTLWTFQSGTAMTLVRLRTHAVWRYHPAGSGGRGAAQHADHILPAMLSVVRLFLGATWLPDWCELCYARDPDARVVEDWLDRSVIFGAPALGVPIRDAELSMQRPPTAESKPELTSVELVAALAPNPPNDPLGAISDVISLRLLEGHTDLDGAAQLLERGPRSLQAYLNRAGASYRALLEEARFKRGAALLQESERSVTEIAIGLGYDEPNNFTRAFRRWAGRTPSDFRSAGERLAARERSLGEV